MTENFNISVLFLGFVFLLPYLTPNHSEFSYQLDMLAMRISLFAIRFYVSADKRHCEIILLFAEGRLHLRENNNKIHGPEKESASWSWVKNKCANLAQSALFV